MTDAQTPDPGPEHTFPVPAAYLDYAENVFIAQGHTVDTAHLVIGEHVTQDLLYTGTTRGAVADVTPGPEADAPEPKAGL
jgi:hypothetical protein